jgi:hypothetical protein
VRELRTATISDPTPGDYSPYRAAGEGFFVGGPTGDHPEMAASSPSTSRSLRRDLGFTDGSATLGL